MIGVNYVYYKYKDKIILRSYLILFGILLKEIESEIEIDEGIVEKIINKLHNIDTKTAKNMIKNADDNLFDSILIKKLMLLSYDYEIGEKFLGKKIVVNNFRMSRIIDIINKIYEINYKKEINFLNMKDYKVTKCSKFSEQIYDNLEDEIKKYIKVFSNILNKSGYKKELSNIIDRLAKYKIKIQYCKNNSSYTKVIDDKIFFHLNNKNKTTLYHEYTHLIQKIIIKGFNIKIKGFQTTLQNEGLANFFAFNLFDNIETEKLGIINLNYLFFPKYSYLYKTIYDKGSNNPKKNYNLLKKELQKLGYKDENEISNLYYRFFRFLPLNQNKYLYPKELLYKIGYERVIESFEGKDPIRHLANLLLYKARI